MVQDDYPYAQTRRQWQPQDIMRVSADHREPRDISGASLSEDLRPTSETSIKLEGSFPCTGEV
jgi:hypothetical protein